MPWSQLSDDEPVGIKTSRQLLDRNTLALLGPQPADRAVRIMVTLPSETATDGALVDQLVAAGMNIARINCAHDDERSWGLMAEQVRRAAREQQREVGVLMDLGGPKLRTGETAPAPSVVKLKPERDMQGVVLEPARVKLYSHRNPSSPDGEIHCISIDPVCIEQLRPGDTLSLVDARASTIWTTNSPGVVPPMWPSSKKMRSPVRTCPSNSGNVQAMDATCGPTATLSSPSGCASPEALSLRRAPTRNSKVPGFSGTLRTRVLRGPSPLRVRRKWVRGVM